MSEKKLSASQRRLNKLQENNDEKFKELIALGWGPDMQLVAIDVKATAIVKLLLDTGLVTDGDVSIAIAETWCESFDVALADAEKQLKPQYGQNWKNEVKNKVRRYREQTNQRSPSTMDKLWFPGKD